MCDYIGVYIHILCIFNEYLLLLAVQIDNSKILGSKERVDLRLSKAF